MTTFTDQPDERWESLSPRFMTMRMVQVGTTFVLLAIAGVTLGLLTGIAEAGVMGGLVLALGLLWIFLERRRVNAWGYCERSEELLVVRGLLLRRLSVVPYGRMQFIDVTAGPVERIFKVATVQLHTAASATDALIPGLDTAEAERLRDQLARRGESRLSGL